MWGQIFLSVLFSFLLPSSILLLLRVPVLSLLGVHVGNRLLLLLLGLGRELLVLVNLGLLGNVNDGLSLVDGSGDLLLLLLLGLLCLLELLGIAVEEEIDGDIPSGRAGDGAAHAEHLTTEEPVEETNRELSLVVGRDGAINVLEGTVGVAERNNGDVHIAGLPNSLGVGAGVGDDQKAGLTELLGDLVGEGTGGEASSDGLGASVLGELKDGTLSVGASRDGNHILGVLDGSDDAGSKHKLLPSLANVQDVDSVITAAPDVRGHLTVAVAGSDVRLGGQEELDVSLGRVEALGEGSKSTHVDFC